MGARLAANKTMEENNFKYEKSSNICAVVVDKDSALGYA